MVGSCVLKPGERHARPTSCRARPPLPLDVGGRPEMGPELPVDMLERLRREGL
jgi:hypothetical protein